ncbi:MAG: hypothetical protein JW827_09535 [Spirochaetes bacterium]|nr:hypothetical protein [Spirochaetota bacterium]
MKNMNFEGEEIVEQDTEYLLENEIDNCSVEYRCEDCDYRWSEIKKPYLSDEDKTGTRLVIDDSAVACPMCGGHQISRV